jgi:hypothetical protein
LPAEFQLINERVCAIKYTDPLTASEMDQSSSELTAYAETATQPLVVIADYTEIRHISTSLISVGLRPGSANPLRNPIIKKIVVIAHLPIIKNLASVVSNILGIEKLVIVRSQAQADGEIELFFQQHTN